MAIELGRILGLKRELHPPVLIPVDPSLRRACERLFKRYEIPPAILDRGVTEVPIDDGRVIRIDEAKRAVYISDKPVF